tara:strand:- start:159 stop:404 length:246 start_codon:yes stop_codon:yes gene_type:complete
VVARAGRGKLKSALARFARCESGEAIEYGLIAALITILLIVGMAASGDHLRGTYNGLSNTWGDSLEDLDANGDLDAPATLD